MSKKANAFLDQLDLRRESDDQMFEQAFADLCSILDPKYDREEAVAGIKNALSVILESFGFALSELPDERMEPQRQLEFMLRPLGVGKRRVELTGDWWKDASGPMLGSLESGEVVALIPGKFSGYTYEDSSGHIVRVNAKTAKDIRADAFCFYRPLPAKKLTIRDLFRFMLSCVTGADFAAVILCALFIALLGMINPFAASQVYSAVIPSGIPGYIWPVACLLLGTVLSSTLLQIISSLFKSRFDNKIEFAVRNASMMRIFAMPAEFFRRYPLGEVASCTSSLSELCTMLQEAILESGLTGLFSLMYVAQMFYYAPTLGWLGMLVILVSIAFSLVTMLVQVNVSRQTIKQNSHLTGFVYELFSGIQKIRLAGAEKRAFAKWAHQYRKLGKLRYAPPLLLRFNAAISLLINLGGTLLLYYAAGATNVPMASYLAFSFAYGAVSGAFLELVGIAGSIAGIKPVLEHASILFDTVPEYGEGKRMVSKLSGGIELNNVTFRYAKDGPTILDGLNLRIRPGEYVAIVGKTGCGKSTLIRLLLGFEKPELGSIYYDGMDLDSLDIASARQCIGVDLQNGKLFAGDIFSNIIVTAPWKTLEDAWEAARLAGIDEDIKSMPMGMHTVIPEGGTGFSGGQRQRILIARALVSNPRIVLFDEATSALDNITQKKISENIAALKCTRIVIAHRLSTIKECDRILVLDGGKVAEQGSYEQLMEKQRIFYDLVKRQTL